ncbi:hypothetical protein GCM10007874_23940 [Labrys miyagiensis]|uniref:Autotransporter domain-containing protein n=1 Tax=Labrys miyagiensis TaxID=346912 RepID=A0ABQ6CM92_9HYPH|nr:autotransporter outer membrane beta-barrel domain-containing protein [Labrys miyagiensis]GLS19377.1 hypothetical protein GCM10007874_23940 [Labrys miyagiensis]
MKKATITESLLGGRAASFLAAALGCATVLATISVPTGPALAAVRGSNGPYSFAPFPDGMNALNTLPTLEQRVGTRYWSNDPSDPETVFCKDPAQNFRCAVTRTQGQVYLDSTSQPFIDGGGLWARTTASFGAFDSTYSHFDHVPGSPPRRTDPTTSSTDARTWQFQMGFDHVLIENDAGKLIGGVNLTYGRAWTSSDSTSVSSYVGFPSTLAHTRVETQGYGAGGTLTWYGQDGFYADAQGQVTWYDSDMDVSSYKLYQGFRNYDPGYSLHGLKGFGYSLGLEAGKRFEIGDGLFLIPQAQVVYSRADYDDFGLLESYSRLPDSFSGSGNASLTSRVGLGVEKQLSWKNADGSISRLSLNGIANLYYVAEDERKLTMAEHYPGLTFIEELDRKRDNAVWGGVGVGATYNWGSRYSVYGQGEYDTSFKDFGNNYKVSGTVGLRMNW